MLANLVYWPRVGRSRIRLISLFAKPQHVRGSAATILLSVALVAGIGIFKATPADAATVLYASPSGTGTTCSSIAPCSLTEALSVTISGDTLQLFPGTYDGNFTLDVAQITLEPAPGSEQSSATQRRSKKHCAYHRSRRYGHGK